MALDARKAMYNFLRLTMSAKNAKKVLENLWR